MTTERYAQLRRLFLAACELAESEIGAFLDHACAGDPELREELASLLKFLALAQTGGDPTCSRFVSEVATAREVAHPNVVRVYDIGQLADGEVFISMEFVDGEDLASLLQRAGRRSCEKTVQIARELCAGLGAAHDHGVLHRETPAPSMVVGGGERTGLWLGVRHGSRGASQTCYFFFAARKQGGSARVKRTTSSPVPVLMSWCRLSTLTPVTSWTIASRTGRAVSIRWVRTCLSRSLPFSAGNDLTSCCSAAVKTPRRRTTRRSPSRWV